MNELERGRVDPLVSQPLPLDSIVCGDNVATLATFPDASIDLVVTSPPYDNLRTYGGHSWDFEGVAQQLWRVIKPGGVVVWVVADATIDGSETGTSFRQALRFMEIGFRLHDTMIYLKPGGGAVGSNQAYWQLYEFMFVLSHGRPKSVNRLADKPNRQAGKNYGISAHHSKNAMNKTRVSSAKQTIVGECGIRGNVWEMQSATNDETTDHPAPFPEALARDHILSWSNECDIVLDPFNGSGTTTKMAREMGRRFIGIEVNEEYCEIARKRLRQQVLEFGAADWRKK